MGMLKGVIILAVLLGLVYGGYYIYQNNPELIEQMAPVPNNLDEINNVSAEVLQFYPNMRFRTNSLTYNIASDCDNEKTRRLVLAFEIISNETKILAFSQSLDNNADILVSCSKNAYQKGERVFMSGEGGPTKIIELSPYPLILQGRVILYNQDDCDYPITEIHELFHVFGFEHISNSKMIMYPYLNCKQRLNPDLINKLIELYSIEAKTEIIFSNVSVIGFLNYVNISFQVKNEGLANAENVIFEVYAGDVKVYDENFGEMNSGTGQEFKLSNLEVPKDEKEINLLVKTDSKEYNKENNLIKVQI